METVAESPSPMEKLGAYALRLVKPGQTLGLGTGRAADAFIRALGESGVNVKGVPTSIASEELARGYKNIELVTLGEVRRIDIDFDGADEVDRRLNLIKGYGGAMVREKVVAAASRRLVILVAEEKLVPRLGARGRLPVEVVPFARDFVTRAVARLGLKASGRQNGDGSEYLTDNGNPILDCAVNEIPNPARLERELLVIPGVVGTGLFVGMVDRVLVAPTDGKSVRVLKKKA
jgi:ribose 5-phosphate isomerase A